MSLRRTSPIIILVARTPHADCHTSCPGRRRQDPALRPPHRAGIVKSLILGKEGRS